MISTQLRMIATAPLLLIGLLLLIVGSNESQQADQVYRLDEQQQQQLVNQLLSDNQQHLNVPGHYEFEMAPKMEPPSVRKPPYQQSAQICPGSNPFDGFSPRDTLCGDLNQGRLPLNPLGQSVLDQTYPFELIKNKTLQFLARALPVLKLEYETIPKVARYLPTNQLLNPTHMASPLTNEQMQRLNQHFSTGGGAGFANAAAAAAASGQGQSIDELLSVASQYSSRRRRRRRRSATGYSSQMSEGITVAELVPNTSLVVSSAHSAGRIGQAPGNGASRNESKGEPLTTVAVITTKDGYKSIQTHLSSSSNSKSNSKSTPNQDNNNSNNSNNNNNNNRQQQQQVVVATQRAQNSANWTPNNNNNNNNVYLAPSAKQATGGGHHFASYPAANSGDKSHQKQQQQSSASSQKTRNNDQQQSSGGRGAANATIENRMDEGAVVGRSSDSQAGAHSGASQVNNNQQVAAATAAAAAASGKQEPVRRRQPCADSNGMIMSALCHVVTAIAEGETKQAETKQPPWFQMLKRFNNVFSGASDSVVSASHPIWTIISSLTGQDVVAPTSSNAKSGLASSSSSSNSAQSMSNLVSMLGHLSNLLSPASAKDASSVSSSSSSDGSRQQNKEQQSSLAALGGSTLRNILVAGWASNLITKLAEYFVPSMMPSASGFSRRKNSYDLRQDRFVETPASLAAANSALSARQVEQATAGANGNKQPPTPCPSVEEFISPTFARNYQGVWRYVVQIPHENYFTQIIQRTSCLRQKCEFTEGACHESPRWVNLLVAEIYYPNTVFGQPATMVADQATAASTGSVVQAPQVQQQQQQQQQQPLQQPQMQPKSSRADQLQMSDSLQSYNQNLNNAFANMAHELNLDPNNVANMQYLANNYNYHLLHRNGLLPSQQAASVAAAEARSSAASSSSSLPVMYSSVMAGQPAPYNAQQQQQSYASDYLAALAQMAIQQNPNMNIQELINSLQAQRRRKRDLGGSSLHNNNNQQQQQQQQQVRQQQHSQQVAQARSNLIESMPSLNDINQMMSPQPQQQQSQQMQPFKPPVGLNQHQQQQQQLAGSPHTTSNSIDQAMSASQVNGQSQLGNEPANQAGGSNDPNGSNNNNQVECDGHDKIGCYVVRVYYDWFLVNGSCKCWKTVNSQTTGASGSSNSNSFLRRIFNG